MADLWTHAVRLDQAVRTDGVAQARIALEDYEGAKGLVQRIWLGEWGKNLRETVRSRGEEVVPARVLLGYLRGYFLYRDIPENDQAFWPHFLEDLGLRGKRLPSPDQYNRLWDALNWHPETRPKLKFFADGSRDFVGTLDAVFHFRALRLAALKSALVQYRETGQVPEEAKPYQKILERLSQALDLLLAEEEPPGLEDQEAVLGFLREAGLHLGEPNPVRLLFYRSPGALRDLYQKLKGRPSSKKRFRHPQVRVEVLSAPRELSEIQAALEPGPLVEGWRVYGKVVLEDGRFRRFYWTPRYSQEGEPLPEEVRLVFPEGEEVRFRLHHKAFGLRLGVARWRLGERLPYRTLGFDQERYPLRFYLASGGGFVTSPEDLKPDLEALHGEGPYKDELIVEVRVDGHSEGWRRLAILPVEVEPGMEIWVSEEGLHVRTDPLGLPVRLRVWAGEAFIGETLAKGDGALAVPKALVPLKVEVGLGNELRTWEMAPKGWPMRWWRLGLGF
jgi:hypothetical protein